ncbi:MAG: dihydrolipoamide acetyltransferase family protein [Candidatus Micrarchaeota archaeon]|nr:dihydrolipoamide acetyltransferase family protein [Candidatus Micrarchaeota archaeon]
MSYDFKLPDLGEGIHEGEVKKWLVKEGDKVKVDQPICEIETDKAVVEMPSARAGIILKIYTKEGQIAKVGNVLVTFGEEGETLQVASQQPTLDTKPVMAAPVVPQHAPIVQTTQVQIATPSYATTQPVTQATQATVMQQPTTTSATNQLPSTHASATPFVRKLARELGVNLEKVKGSGSGGRITEEDVKKSASGVGVTFEEAKEQGISPQPALQKVQIIIDGDVERLSFRGIRRKIAEHMVISQQTAVHVTHMDEIDLTDLVRIREMEKAEAEKKGVKLTYLAFIVRACVAALREFPQLNSSLDEEKAELVIKKYYNIGIAVDTDDGLMVPVIKNADRKPVLEIARAITELADKARKRTITLDEMRGGSFTITNIGSAGGTYATPIINYPEVAILGVMKMADRAVVRNGQIEIRKIMNMVLSFDHRVIDGAMAAKFVNTVKKHLEDPALLLVDE